MSLHRRFMEKSKTQVRQSQFKLSCFIFYTTSDDNYESWLKENVQFPYWENRQDVVVDSDDLSAVIAHTVEKERVKQGELKVEAIKMTEYQVIREVLWMLRQPTQSPLFTMTSDDRFVVSS